MREQTSRMSRFWQFLIEPSWIDGFDDEDGPPRIIGFLILVGGVACGLLVPFFADETHTRLIELAFVCIIIGVFLALTDCIVFVLWKILSTPFVLLLRIIRQLTRKS